MTSRASRFLKKRVRTVLWITLLCLFLALYISTLVFIYSMFQTRVEIFETTPDALGLVAHTVTLISEDNIILKAWRIPAQTTTPLGNIILLHGMNGMDASSMLGHAKFLNESGYNTFVLDMRAHGRSGGQRIGLAIEEPLDVSAAIKNIQENIQWREFPLAVLGISLGGATAIRTAAKHSEIDAVISIGSFASIDRMFHKAVSKNKFIKTFFPIYQPFLYLGITTLYSEWPSHASPLNDIKKISPCAIFIIHGGADEQVPVEHARLLHKATQGKAQLWIIENAGHIVFSGDSTGPENALYRKRIKNFLFKSLNPQLTYFLKE